jgi:hypothetical protein
MRVSFVIKNMLFLCMFYMGSGILHAQEKGLIEFGNVPDSMIVFTSPRPLITDNAETLKYSSFWSIELLFSGNGFGAGCSYSKHLSPTLSLTALLGITGNRNSDELEYIDQLTGRTFIPNKVNSLYSFPFTIGMQKRLFQESLSESFRPFIGAGLGYSMILQIPYDQNGFEPDRRTLAHGRPASYLSIGSAFGSEGRTSLSALIRYYFIPFGGNGIDSINDLPIKDFGGLFIALGIAFGN